MPNILEKILQKRNESYLIHGPSFGHAIPKHRMRPIVPFLAETGVILEVKRASPSKGDIAPTLDPLQLVAQYKKAGAKNISILTEQEYFKGSLEDLISVSSANPDISFLRKDFIQYEDEIEVSYRAGADAVLLIARILSEEKLINLATACAQYNLTAFVEVRDKQDIQKLKKILNLGRVISGVNSRDLANFRLDPLIPASLRAELPGKAVFESGANSPETVAFARRLGYEGILIGEAAAKKPEQAHELVKAFEDAKLDWVGQFWREISKRKEQNNTKPLVKICGITNGKDAIHAAACGADLLGFVFAESPRKVDYTRVKEIYSKLQEEFFIKPENCENSQTSSCARPREQIQRPLLIGVIVDPESKEAIDAIALVKEGILDAIQYHGESYRTDLAKLTALGGTYGMGYYVCARIGSEKDILILKERSLAGEPRVLVDARVEGLAGGTGTMISKELIDAISAEYPLWLAGGLNHNNIRTVLETCTPELVDASSGLEISPGKKNLDAVSQFITEVKK